MTEKEFMGEIERLCSKFEKKRREYVGENYQNLIFTDKITYKNFIKIHNFKAQVTLPLPNCDCIFTDLAGALSKPTLKEKLEAIGRLPGFRLPMASAVLHFSEPNTYAIIDENVIKGMKKLGWNTRTLMVINKGTIEYYKYYLRKIQNIVDDSKIKDIAKKYDITSTRLVEVSLYVLGKGW